MIYSYNTIATYELIINKLSESYYLNIDNNINIEHVIDLLSQNISNNSVITYLCAILWYLKSNFTDNTKIINKLSDKISSMTIQEKEIQNIAKKKKTKAFLTSDKNEILNEWNKILILLKEFEENKYKSQYNYKKYLFLSLYVALPRLNMDYEYLFIANSINETKNDDRNYYVRDRKLFIFNVYKKGVVCNNDDNCQTRQVIVVTKLLSNIINEYIDRYNIKGSVFDFDSGSYRYYTSLVFENIQIKCYDEKRDEFILKKVNITNFRNLYVLYLYHKGKLDTTEKQINISKLIRYDIIGTFNL